MLNSSNSFILIVDDNPTNLSVLSQALKAEGYKVHIAMNGEEALEQVDFEHPELVLLDIEMPKLDGFETCRRLQANSATAGIPIIFMTALADSENKVKGLSLGAVDYITKPFEQAEVLARVKVHRQLKQLTDSLEQQVAERSRSLEQTQMQLVQQEKMSALGNLVAGVAHEINNPLGFLNGSINNGKDYVQDLLRHLALYQQHYPNPVAPIQDHAEDIDLEFLSEDLPKLLNSMQDATDRITSISTSLRTFSRADTDHKVSINLHEGIDSTLLILKYRLKANEFRPAIEVIKEYGEISTIDCFPGQLNQVFMNIIANAIDMFDEMAQTKTFAELEANPQRIIIRTAHVENTVQISIQDNGKGMTEDIRSRIFDHLFTTKEVGKGTGLGLAIARQIVVDKHGGRLEVQSEPEQGTAFCIRLAIAG